jgi:hypothetical protein
MEAGSEGGVGCVASRRNFYSLEVEALNMLGDGIQNTLSKAPVLTKLGKR